MEARPSFDSDEETAAGSESDIPIIEGHVCDAGLLVRSTIFSSQYKVISLSRHPRWLVRVGKQIILALIPSFLTTSTTSTASKPSDATNIAALDGLRGLACFFVFNEHLTYNFSTSFLLGYGYAGRRSVIQFPFIRIFWSGFSMVSIFYVISGYVLSYKPLKQMRGRDMASCQATLTSSILRRAMRLYLPTIIAVLLCGLFASLGAFNYSTFLYQKDSNYLHLHEIPPPIHNTFFLQIKDTIEHSVRMLNVWDWSDDLSAGDYDRHLWTIGVEFRSSMVLFLLLSGVSRLKQTYRLLTNVGMIMFCILTERKDVLLFVAGMLIADIDLIRETQGSLKARMPHQRIRLPSAKVLWLLTFIIGLYLSSVPTVGCDETAGYRTLSLFVPSCWSNKASFLRSVGAVLITWSIANSDFLNPLFTNNLALYLGKISFALYLVHGNVLKSLGYAVMPAIYRVTNGGTREGITPPALVMSWMLAALITVPVTLWLSDMFWRGIDTPCVKFARWVERKISHDTLDFDNREWKSRC